MKNPKANIQFINFKVSESHIVFKQEGNYKIEIGFEPRGEVLKSNCLFILKLGIQVSDKNKRFLIELDTSSTFKYSKKANLEEYLDSLFVLNAPAIVFPYLRAYITNMTSQSGMTPLILPTLNLSKLGENLKNNISISE